MWLILWPLKHSVFYTWIYSFSDLDSFCVSLWLEFNSFLLLFFDSFYFYFTGPERRGSVNSWSGHAAHEYSRRRRLTLGPGLIMPCPNDLSVPYYYGVVSTTCWLLLSIVRRNSFHLLKIFATNKTVVLICSILHSLTQNWRQLWKFG